jgi:hypothetical protein
MQTYFANETIEFFDTVAVIENENITKATVIITNDVSHCHLMRHIGNKEITVRGVNKPKYSIYINPMDNISNPNWCFNSTLFFYFDNEGISFSNLHFTYFIEEYDFINISDDYDLKTKKNIKIIDFKKEQLFNSFNVLLMEFYNSKIIFKDCIFENNTNRTFEIIVKKQSIITFENCIFNGDFNFIFDIDSKIVIQ